MREPGNLRPQDLSPAEHLALCWHYLGGGTWGAPTAAQIALAEAIASPQNDRMIACMFRGVGKSTVTAAMLTRFWLFDPSLLIGVVAAEQDLAEKITGQVRELLNIVPMFRDLRPRGKSRKRRGGFDVGGDTTEQTQSMWARGIFGNFTGCRADIILADDIEVPNNCDSQGNREKLWARAHELGPLLRRDGPCRIQFNGTPHSDNSLYWRLVREDAYNMMVWTARYPNEDEQKFHGNTLHPRIVSALRKNPGLRGTPTDRRFDEAALVKAQRDVGGAAQFARQYQLDPRVADLDKYPLKFSNLMVMDLVREAGPKLCVYGQAHPIEGVDHLNVGFDGDRFFQPLNLKAMEFAPYEDKALFVDPSGSGQDETAYIVAGWVHGYLCILDWGGNTHWGSVLDGFGDVTLSRLVELAKKWECPKIVVEKRYTAGVFTALMQKHVRASGAQLGVLEEQIPGIGKERRMLEAIRPMVEQHRVILNRPLIETDFTGGGRSHDVALGDYRALYQFSHLSEKAEDLPHDDRIDALALACHYWRARAGIDAGEALRRIEEAEIQAEYDALLPDGQKPPTRNGVQERGSAARIALVGFDRRGGMVQRGSRGNWAVPNNPTLRGRRM